jgi:ribosomal protein L27
VGLAKDHSLFALVDGVVRFEDHGGRGKSVTVVPVVG